MIKSSIILKILINPKFPLITKFITLFSLHPIRWFTINLYLISLTILINAAVIIQVSMYSEFKDFTTQNIIVDYTNMLYPMSTIWYLIWSISQNSCYINVRILIRFKQNKFLCTLNHLIVEKVRNFSKL